MPAFQVLKLKGRMKTPYYVATVVNAYNRRLNEKLHLVKNQNLTGKELCKTSNREFTTGFLFWKNNKQNFKQSGNLQTHTFVALVLQNSLDGYVLVEQRNRFKVGDELEVLSPNDTFNKIIKVDKY